MSHMIFRLVAIVVIVLMNGNTNASGQAIPTAILPFQARVPIQGDMKKDDENSRTERTLTIETEEKQTRFREEDQPIPSSLGTLARRDVTSQAISALDNRGKDASKDIAAVVEDLLTVRMLASDTVMLIERQEINRILDELKLSRAGLVHASEATEVGRLSGAKLLITGSIVTINNDLYLIAKVMGVETSRLAGASVKGPANSDLGELVEKLAVELENTLKKKAESLLPKLESEADWVAEVKKKLEGKKLPTVVVNKESKNGTLDLAAMTELERLLQVLGFETIAWDHPNAPRADIEIAGEAKSEFAYRRGDWVASRCRIDLQARSLANGKSAAADSETYLVFDITEKTAGKKGLQEATRRLASRMTLKLAK